jgi:hypothetical protein
VRYLQELESDPLIRKVAYLGDNIGGYAPWHPFDKKRTIMDWAYPELWRTSNYIVTDDDLDLSGALAAGNLIEWMKRGLDRNPKVIKVGPALEYLDLPRKYPLKNAVVADQEKHWQEIADSVYDGNGRRNVLYYNANIDTTMAMYRVKDIPEIGPRAMGNGLRIGRPFSVKHLPWYKGVEDLTSEDWYYLKTTETYTYWTDLFKDYVKARKVESSCYRIL